MAGTTFRSPPTTVGGSPSGEAGSRRDRILAWIRSNPELPTPPAIALRVIDVASDPECEITDLADLIAKDPALCAKVLRSVNSAVYGLRHPVSSIPAAVRFLGIHPLRSLVLAFTLSNLRWSPLPPAVLQTHWRVSLAGALAARQLAVLSRRAAPDNDLVAGLVRDLGVLALHQLFPAEYRTVLNTSPEVLSAFQCELEVDAMQVEHAEVGAELLRAWHMPDEIIEPVRYHHDLSGGRRLGGDLGERAVLLYLASQIGQIHLTANRPMLVREVRALAADHFKLDERALRAMLESVQMQVKEFAAAMDVDLGSSVDLPALVSRGIEELGRITANGSGRFPVVGTGVPVAAPRKVEPTTAVGSPPAAARSGEGAVVEEMQTLLFSRPGQRGLLGVLDGYEVTALLGAGAMGAVFRATDPRLERTVAIKALLPHWCADPQVRTRFLREGRAIAALSHENVVRVYAVGEARGVPYQVMEHVAGSPLEARLRPGAPLPLPEVLRLGADIAGGLAAAHAQGLLHRDIKPANLLVEEATGRVKIADFGLVLMADQPRLSQAGGPVGTPYFMSPEQADGLRLDAKSDLFSLGAVLYLACTGRLPFEGESVLAVLRAVCDRPHRPMRLLNPAVPPWLEEVVGGLLAKDPKRRFPPAAELKRLFLLQRARLYTADKGRP